MIDGKPYRIKANPIKSGNWSAEMSYPLSQLVLFSFSVLIGTTMLSEGFLIVKMQKAIIPIPSKILYWIGVGLIGKEKSTKWFAGKNTPESLRTYAFFALFFGTSLLVSSFIYLNWMVTQS
jgi:hypothetical protein